MKTPIVCRLVMKGKPRLECRRFLGKGCMPLLRSAMVHAGQNVYTEYADPKLSKWTTKIQPALNRPKLKTPVEACGKKPGPPELIELPASRSKPHRKTQELLGSVLRKLGFLCDCKAAIYAEENLFQQISVARIAEEVPPLGA